MNASASDALGLYIHLPFCARKCPYCDFYSVAGADVAESRYVEALLRELAGWRERLRGDLRSLHSVFLGGGTPSLLASASIRAILDGVRGLWPLEPGCEITLEANPDSCTAEKPEAWFRAGVNRVSLGVQALDDARLRLLGRPHDVAQARAAVAALRGFERVNLDLIHSTPGQDLAQWRGELEQVLAWGAGHLSCYGLAVEPGTPFQRLADAGALTVPGEEAAVAFFEITREVLALHGYVPYEISNFARPGQACRHNLLYWAFGDYLGIGAAAHGKWTDGAGMVWRSENPRDLGAYLLSGPPPPRPVPPEEAARESLLMGLRLRRGLRRETYARLAGRDLVAARPVEVAKLVAAGLLELTPERIRIPPHAVLLADAIMLELL